MTESLNHIAESWYLWMLPMLWQVAVLIAIVWAADFLIRKWVWPQVRYALWLLVLVKLVLPPSLTSPTSFTAEIPFLAQKAVKVQINQPKTTPEIVSVTKPVESVGKTTTENVPLYAETSAEPIPANITTQPAEIVPATAALSWKAYAFFVWLAGIAVLSIWLIIRLAGLRREHLKSNQQANLPDRFKELIAATAQKLRLKKIPQVILTNKVCCPAVFGVFRPVLLIPADKLAKLTRQDAEHILLHELAHIKRGDLFVHAIYIILQIAYWFNPLLWLIRRQLQNLRELCCDATVARILREKTFGYRETLLETARQLLAEPVDPGLGLLGLFENSNRLIDRLRWLEKKSWKNRPLRILTIFVLVCLMATCVLPMAKFDSPPTFTIKGIVTDAQTGQPIAGARVGDVERYAEGKQWTTTDANGNYSYKTWYEEHATRCEAAGYKTETKGLLTKLFGSEKERILNFKLVPEKTAEQSKFKTASPSGITVEPSGADSDGDGLSDFQEVHKYLTDPAKKDSDGDGIDDGNWDERREYTYSVRTILQYMPPFDEKALNDDFQDTRVLSKTNDYIEIEVIHYPFGTADDGIKANPNWQTDYAKMSEYLAPGITTNWDQKMKKDLIAELKADGIDVTKLTDKEVVEKVSRWAIDKSKYLDKVFTTYYVHFPNGKPQVYPGLEKAFEDEFNRDKDRYNWTIDEHFEHELLGRGMFYNKTRGSCTSTAVYLTTVLRAVGIPTRMIMVVPAVDASNEEQLRLAKDGITHNEARAKALVGLGRSHSGFTDHVFNEVYIGNRWHRLNYTKLGQPILDIHCFGLHTHLYTFNDLSEADLAPTWGLRYGKGIKDDIFGHSNPYTAVEMSDSFGRYCKIDNPPFSTAQLASGELPDIFIMEPSRTKDSSFSIWEEVLARVKDATHNKTGRKHKKQFYDDIFDGVYIKKPSDYMVLLFSLDTKERIPIEYEDLLPKPWSQIEQALSNGQTVELAGKARDMNVILLAAPEREQLKHLIQQTKLLNIGTEPTETEAITSGFKTKLINGVTVELVGVCEHPSKGKQWWRPDGSLIEQPLYETTGGGVSVSQQGYDEYEFAGRVSGVSGFDIKWDVPDGTKGTHTGSPIAHNGSRVSDLNVYTVNQPQSKKQSIIRIGVASGPWDMSMNIKSTKPAIMRIDDIEVGFAEPYENNGVTYVPVTYLNGDFKNKTVTLFAVDKNKSEHRGGYTGSGGNKLSIETYSFNLPLEGIEQFKFKSRSYDWVTFKNVSLKPGFKTDVQIKVEGTKKADADYSSVTVYEGFGFDDIIVGDPRCSKEFIKSKFGRPEDDSKDLETDGWWISYRGKNGLDFWFDNSGILKEIRLNENFKGSLTSGISISSVKGDVFGIYGRPIAEETVDDLQKRLDGKIVHRSDRILYKGSRQLNKPEISKIYYHQNGLLFWFEGNRINQIVIFPKKENPAEQVEVKTSAEKVNSELTEAWGDTAQTLLSYPIIERVVNNEGTGKDYFIDFETGDLFSPPKQPPDSEDPFHTWLKETGIDAEGAAGGRGNIKGLACFDMIVIPVDNISWEDPNKAAFFVQFLDKGKIGSPVFMLGKGELPVTYMFKTREGSVGILQITGFTDEPKGTKIRYRILRDVTEKPAVLAEGKGEKSISFGAVIERLVNDDNEKTNMVIDLDSGDLVTPPDELHKLGAKEQLAWFAEKGIDAGCETNEDVRGLFCVDLVAIPVLNDRWETISAKSLSKDEVLQQAKPGTLAFMGGKGELPITYQFKTREGGIGILQIIGFSDSPKGVKIRYKMVQQTLPKPTGQVEGESQQWIRFDENKAGEGKPAIGVDACVWIQRGPAGATADFLRNKLGLEVEIEQAGNLSMLKPVQLTDEQAEKLKEWAESAEGIKLISVPRFAVTDGELGDIRLTETRQFITGYKEPNEPSENPQPVFEKLTIGTTLKIRPELQPDKKTIRLGFDFKDVQIIGVEKQTDSKGRDIELPQTELLSAKTSLGVIDSRPTIIQVGGGEQEQIFLLVKAVVTNIQAEKKHSGF